MRRDLSWANIIKLAGAALATLGAASLIAALYLQRDAPEEFLQSLLMNIGTEMIAMAIAVLVLDVLYRRVQEDRTKKELIRDMGSADNNIALRAVQELKAKGWLRDGSLDGANLEGMSLLKARLKGVRLKNANLRKSRLIAVNMQDADLRSAHIEDAMVAGCDFRGADMWDVKFGASEIHKVDLSTSHLVGADFEKAKISRIDLRDVRYGLSTRWPDGFSAQEAGAVDQGNWVGSFVDYVADEMLEIAEGDKELLRLLEEE